MRQRLSRIRISSGLDSPEANRALTHELGGILVHGRPGYARRLAV